MRSQRALGADAVDLRARFGDRYRVRREARGATWFDTPAEERVWLLELPCRYGVVYPQGGKVLAAWTGHPRIGRKLRGLGCILSARGDLETIVTFHVGDAKAVFGVLKPYRRRRLSEAQRRRQVEILARARAQQHRKSLSQGELLVAESTQLAGDCGGGAVPPSVHNLGAEVAPRPDPLGK